MRTGKLDLAEAAKRAFALASTGTKWRHPWATDDDVLSRDAMTVSRGECRVIHMCHEKPPRPHVGQAIADSLMSAECWEASVHRWDGTQPARSPGSFQGGSGSDCKYAAYIHAVGPNGFGPRPPDPPGFARVVFEGVAEAELEAAGEKVAASLIDGECVVGVITTFQSFPLASSDLPPEWVFVTVSAFGLDSRRKVIPVAATLSVVCGPRDHSTPEGVAGRHPIWTSLDRSGTGHDPLPAWVFPANPFLGSRRVNEGMGTCEVDLAEVAIRAFEVALEAMAYK